MGRGFSLQLNEVKPSFQHPIKLRQGHLTDPSERKKKYPIWSGLKEGNKRNMKIPVTTVWTTGDVSIGDEEHGVIVFISQRGQKGNEILRHREENR